MENINIIIHMNNNNNNIDLEELFIKHMNEFLHALSIVFYDVDFIDDGRKYIHSMNEKYLMRNWKKYIGDPYREDIETMNISRIIDKIGKQQPKRREAQSQMFMKIMAHTTELSSLSKKNLMKYLSNITQIVDLYLL